MIPAQERDELYLVISAGRLLHSPELNRQTIRQVLSQADLELADAYIAEIRDIFGLDFTGDEDFYITLTEYIHYLLSPARVFSDNDKANLPKETLLTELDLAWLFEKIFQKSSGRSLSEVELLHLANCTAGALEYQLHNHPEAKIRTVICCHMHLSVAWAIKRKLLGRFSIFLEIVDIIPVNLKSSYDFTGIDLILSTVHKQITDAATADTIEISPQMIPEDIRAVETYIQRKQILKLHPLTNADLRALFDAAWWYEEMDFTDLFQTDRFHFRTLCLAGDRGQGVWAGAAAQGNRLQPCDRRRHIVSALYRSRGKDAAQLSAVETPHSLSKG